MPSTYSSNLKIELQATGENSNTWGTITNTNLGTALEQAIVGYGNPNYASDANLTLTYTDTNAAQAARALVLNVTSGVSLSTTRELIVPTIQKQYIVQNNTTGSQSITVKTSAGTGITVPNGRKAHLYVNGTDVIYMDDYVDINGGAIDGTPIGANSASTGSFTTLATSSTVTVNGGTANQVQYLNASKQQVGSANLTFDGTTLTAANFADSSLTSGRVTYAGASGNLTDSASLTFDGTTLATTTVDATNVEVTNVKAKDGTAAASIADSTGVISFTSDPILSAGTANGVLYLNGSKVATSGSALTFSGTEVGIVNATPSIKFTDTDNSADSYIQGTDGNLRFFADDNQEAASSFISWAVDGSEQARLNTTGLGIGTSSPAARLDVVTGTARWNISNDGSGNIVEQFLDSTGAAYRNLNSYANNHILYTSGAERMRLDSSGNLGIGTSSPGAKLDVNGSINLASTQNLQWGSSALAIAGASNILTFYTNSAERLRIDSSGNVGIGTTSPVGILDVVSSGSGVVRMRSSTGSGTVGFQAQNSDTGTTTLDGTFFGIDASEQGYVYNYENAPLIFGTNSAERMRLDASGSLLLGTTASVTSWTSGRAMDLQIAKSGAIYPGISSYAYSTTVASGGMVTLGRSRGSFGTLSTTSANDGLGYLAFEGVNSSNTLISPAYIAAFQDGAAGATNIPGRISFFTSSGSANPAERLRIDSAGNMGLGVTPSAWGSDYRAVELTAGAISSTTAGNTFMQVSNAAHYNNTQWIYKYTSIAPALYQQTAGQHRFLTAPSGTAGNTITFTQALTLDANVNLLLNGTTAPASGVGTFAIFNGTAPTGSVTNGCVLYTEDVSSSSELKVRDEAGNVTTLSPHNFSLIPEGASEDMAWAYYSEKGGKRINVDMLKLARMVEKLTGEKLVYEA